MQAHNFRFLQRPLGSELSVLACLLLLGSPSSALGECQNAAVPTCDMYTKCFAKYCNCKGSDDEYFETYGASYCNAFLGAAKFSEVGKVWRDSTLRCLQESIVPRLNLDNPTSCNCKTMKDFAYQSHVACYTSPANSICDLPAEDIYEIYSIVKIKDALTSEGWKQMHTVSEICSKTSKDDGRRTIWKTIESILSIR
ncbi:hypothetical protein ACQKPC_22535 [Pseudomonas sp. NPDC089918]|uniref:hypothetical protein n=1 Tax=Pseudomonas sp. NPDC089918 TaxID=3390654 RepID=UPI003CFFDAD3